MIIEKNLRDLQIGIYQRAKNGRPCCGDSFLAGEYNERTVIAIADGLGSGEMARKASVLTISHLRKHWDGKPKDILGHCNEKLKGTRGAVLSMVSIDPQKEELSFCGIGNVQLIILKNDAQCMHGIPSPGFLAGLPVMGREDVFTFERGDTLLMYSDGFVLPSRWKELVCCLHSVSELIYELIKNINEKDDLTLIVARYTI
ncbi:SpoIIE family protein phosphatase [Microaerobacter geothermalis]|uniref:PP2C family serine/threonine-protein phosphatase n=1 Tax=Microaerobacter geothermalis TaxID=674972 RepID=UPI001F209130|nr:PP2C family serine/threonine-protein phosphatase [Microaerobacter geothermalis]MCF6093750.1 SpoIIE family protein phosphatase [Microaerobacter geothermalis]